MFLLSLNFIVLAFGGFWFHPRLIGTFMNWILAFCHLAVILFTLFARFNPFGNWCSFNVASFDDSDNIIRDSSSPLSTISSIFTVKNYRDDAQLMLNLAMI